MVEDRDMLFFTFASELLENLVEMNLCYQRACGTNASMEFAIKASVYIQVLIYTRDGSKYCDPKEN